MEEALAVLDHLVEAGTDEARGHRAWLLRSQGRYEDSLADYEALLSANPSDAEAARQRADLLRLMGRHREAATALLARLAADPLDIQATRMLAACQQAAGASEAVPSAPPLPTGPPPPSRPLNPVIDALERDLSSYPVSSFPEVGRLLYNLARCLRPALVVETGCHVGYSTLCLAQALEDTGGGHIHSFDLFLPRPGYASPVLGPCEDTLAAARGHLERAGLPHRATLHKGDSSQMIRQAFAPAPPRSDAPLLDLVFIDGDHAIKGCLADFHAVQALVRPGGFVLVHDTMPEQSGWVGPRYLLESLPLKAGGAWQAINLPSPEGFGLGILQKAGGGLVGQWRPSLADVLRERWLGLWRRNAL